MSDQYYSDDCAITAISCLLPDASSPEEFWNNLINANCSIKPISKNRWDKELNYSPFKEIDDKAFSYMGAEIDDSEYKRIAKKFSIKDENPSRLDLMALDCIDQIFKQSGKNIPKEKIGMIFGVMNPDEFTYLTRLKPHIDKCIEILSEKYKGSEFENVLEILSDEHKKLTHNLVGDIHNLFPSSVIDSAKKYFPITGRSFLVDAACASGIASIDYAVKMLKSKKLDFVIAGGLESNLCAGTYLLFSKVGALSPDKCLPFDTRSLGLSQGEGAVLFGIKRLEDAKRDNDKIFGIIRGVGASSDGRSASLFQPNVVGQMLAYDRAYKKLKSKRVDFIELHGTGTVIGDRTEAQSAATFFSEFKIPVGSVKALVGHTKATAGATSLLKSILSFKNKTIPPSTYLETPVFNFNESIFINKNEISLDKKQNVFNGGISSFGFGGTNFHLTFEQSSKLDLPEFKTPKIQEPRKMLCLGHVEFDFDQLNTDWFIQKHSFYKIPPKSLPFIDKAQLLAVYSAYKLLKEKIGIILTPQQEEETCVLSASTLGLEIIDQLVSRVSLDTISEELKREIKSTPSVLKQKLSEDLIEIKNKFTPVTEESGPGILNNVIAGRVANAFNFKGKNLNIDSDQASIAQAIELIKLEIEQGANNLYILVGVEQEIDVQNLVLKNKKMHCFAFSSEEFAKKNFLKVFYEVQSE